MNIHTTASRFETPHQMIRYMHNFAYTDYDFLMDPDEVYQDKRGSCHDQAFFELDELERQGLNPEGRFLIAVDKDGIGEETHSFVYYKDDDKWCWLENAWKDLRGIRYYTSEQELIDSVMFAFGQRNAFDKLYIANFNPSEHTIGEDLETFVDICMNSAEEYQIS